MSVTGIERVKTNYKRFADQAATTKTESAIYQILTNGANLAKQKTPVDTSNLINSQSIPQIAVNAGKVTGQVVYGASYALYVHEAPGTLKGLPREHFGTTRAGVEFGGGTGNGNYWSPNAEPHFLTKGFEELKPQIPEILRSVYRV